MLELEKRIRDLLRHYAENDRHNTQDMTEIGSYLLKREGIEHQTYSNESVPYYWIMLEDIGIHISFKSGKVIFEKDCETSLSGSPINMLANSVTFEALTGEHP